MRGSPKYDDLFTYGIDVKGPVDLSEFEKGGKTEVSYATQGTYNIYPIENWTNSGMSGFYYIKLKFLQKKNNEEKE